ncbi:hypothetical protein [Aeromicrobium sp. Leaf350]|uniref:hypothetical protein n=1 Tax=Aeromicrobium sp. Leaf350 TaxID=2876565 RepID=UPI001E4F892D|nr:hypothetical protein [Aeromicrobium sp. Leaf350]
MNDAIEHGSEVSDEVVAPAVEPTGHAAIDEALSALSLLADQPVTEHVVVFDAIHQVVRTSLAEAGRAEVPESP